MNNKIIMAFMGLLSVNADLGDPVYSPPYHREGWPATHEVTGTNTQAMINDKIKKNWWKDHAKPTYESENEKDDAPPAQGQVGKQNSLL